MALTMCLGSAKKLLVAASGEAATVVDHCSLNLQGAEAMALSRMKPSTRLYVLLARKAPLAVVFRRGLSKQVLLLMWNTDTHTRCDKGSGSKAASTNVDVISRRPAKS
jgi:hypothetical protein